MSLSPVAIVSAHPWQRVAFTTYALSLSFFEAVILDGLVRGKSRAQALILADIHGVRESLSERGASRVGRDYEVEPVKVAAGVFHPKIAVFASAEECHVLVGSGNLTFNGWGGNCELVEHLHPAIAAGAIADVAGFFERLADGRRASLGAGNECLQLAASLRRAVRDQPRNDDIRFIHNLDAPLTGQIARAAEELGGAKRLVAAAPYWDDGAALDTLCRALGLDEAHLHSHARGCVEGAAGNWPRKARTTVHAVRLDAFDESTEAARRLHAKAFEIVCRRGRLVVSGSANGTTPALGKDLNVESCVIRVEGKAARGWKFKPSEPPALVALSNKTEEDKENQVGVLRAVLDGDKLVGQVLIPTMNGTVTISHAGLIGPETLADAMIDSQGRFTIKTPNLEKWSWRGGRLVLRVTDESGRAAEGFVSQAGYAEIARRGGPATPRLFALIFGSETPADVAAILDWFLEDPRRLAPAKDTIQGHVDSLAKEEPEQLIPIEVLDAEFVNALAAGKPADSGGRHWWYLLDKLLGAFREPRGRFELRKDLELDDEEEGTQSIQVDEDEDDPAIEAAYESFGELFELLTSEDAPPRHIEIAFDLTGFICARLNPEKPRAQSWLVEVIRAWLTAGVRIERREDVAAAILTLLGIAPDAGQARWARGALMQLGRDLAAAPPSNESVCNYLTVLRQKESFAQLWARLQEIRTYQEQANAYLRALESGKPAPETYPDLPAAAAESWPALARAFASRDARKKLLIVNGAGDVCPEDHWTLPQLEIERLRTTCIAVAKNCCGKVLIRKEP
jgi:hypothetical protein